MTEYGFIQTSNRKNTDRLPILRFRPFGIFKHLDVTLLNAVLAFGLLPVSCIEGKTYSDNDDKQEEGVSAKEQNENNGTSTDRSEDASICGKNRSDERVTLFDFAEDSEGFSIRYSEPGSLEDTSELIWDDSNGEAGNGSLRVTVPFADKDQKVQVSAMITPSEDLSETVLSAQIRLNSGLNTNSEDLGGAKLYVKSGNEYIGAYGSWVNLVQNQWITATIDLCEPDWTDKNNAAIFDAKDIVEIGVDLATGSFGTYSEAIIQVDTFTSQ